MNNERRLINPETNIPYTGLEKAAMLMLSLPDEQAQIVFSYLDPDEIKELSEGMINLGAVRADTIEMLCVEFVNELASSGSLVGSVESTERLLSRVLSEDSAEKIMEEIRGPAGRTLWDKLSNVNEEILANYLKNEYPQTVAVVLTRIKPKSAAIVLGNLPDQLADDVVKRMLRIETVRKDVLEGIENTLRKEFMSNIARSSKGDSYELVADIFNNLDKSSETRLLGNIEAYDASTAERIRNLMFTFEDLSQLDSGSIQMVMKNVDRAKLGLALKGLTSTIADKFIKNMSERAAKLLKDEMDNMGAVRVKDVENAQNQIIAVAKDMATRNEININGSNDNEEMVS